MDHEDYSGECAEDLCIVEGAIGYELISWGSAAAVGIYNWIHGPSLPAIHHAEQAPGSRPGKPFTQKGKDAVKDRNKKQNGGKQTCENPSCGKETVPGKKGEKGVTPPGNETNVDHVDPKSKGGSGTPENGQILCRDCNMEKGANSPQPPQPQPQAPPVPIPQVRPGEFM